MFILLFRNPQTNTFNGVVATLKPIWIMTTKKVLMKAGSSNVGELPDLLTLTLVQLAFHLLSIDSVPDSPAYCLSAHTSSYHIISHSSLDNALEMCLLDYVVLCY